MNLNFGLIEAFCPVSKVFQGKIDFESNLSE